MQTCVWSAYLLDCAPEEHSLSCIPINLHLCLPGGEGLFSAYMSVYWHLSASNWIWTTSYKEPCAWGANNPSK